MEAVLFLLLIIILFLVVSIRGNLNDRVGQIQSALNDLNDQIRDLKRPEAPVEPKPAPSIVKEPVTEPLPPPVTVRSIPVKDEWQTSFKRMEPEEPVSPAALSPVENSFPEPVAYTPVIAPVPDKPREETFPVPAELSFFERYPDLEKFIGENLVSKIGIAILVIAIGFFVKYAIDQEWIGPVARVGIGILCGGILIALAHRLRNSYRAFSSVLTGGGLAVFYFTITLAYQQFHLFSQTGAFVIMLVITAFSVVLSLLYDKQEVAIIALIGGFATPFMVSNGSGNYIALFSYLLILNAGLLVIAYFKGWRLLNLLAFIFTVILFGSWLATFDGPDLTATYTNGLWFATAFYVIFFIINVAHNIKENKRFIASDFGILLANTALYFGAGLYCLTMAEHEAYRGLFSALMGMFNLVVSFILFRNKKADPNILYLLIGITLTFISLTAPVQLKGNYITLFWGCETVLLYWLFQKSKIAIIQLSSLIIWGAMLLSLFMDWSNIYMNSELHNLPVILNKGFVTSVFSAAATFLLFVLRKKDAEDRETAFSSLVPQPLIYFAASLVLLYISGALEINYQFTDKVVAQLYLLLYTYAFVLIFLAIISKKIAGTKMSIVKPLLLCAGVLLYLVETSVIFNIQKTLKTTGVSAAGHFAAHWINAVMVAIILWQLVQWLRKNSGASLSTMPVITWALCGIVVIYLSVELHLLVNAFYVQDAASWWPVHTQFIKIGLPILWGLCSFGFMWLGMHHKYRTLRIISLVLFAITLFKLFVFDIRNIAEGGKIAAFFCLGVLLLVISFMYQRLKKIIIDDELLVAKKNAEAAKQME